MQAETFYYLHTVQESHSNTCNLKVLSNIT